MIMIKKKHVFAKLPYNIIYNLFKNKIYNHLIYEIVFKEM